MSSTPTVSVCIPMYNAGKYIGETVRSVLSQTVDDFEIVVVDNASTDNSVEVVESFADSRIRLLRNSSNLGQERNWNRSVDEARGLYTKLLCADDLLYPQCLEKQVVALESHPDASFVACRRDIIGPDSRPLLKRRGPRRTGELSFEQAMRTLVRSGTNPFGEPAAVLMRTTARDKAGHFDGSRPWMIDVEYWARLLDLGTVVVLPETLSAFRVIRGSWSHELSREQSRQARAFFYDLRRRHPDVVRRADVVVGAAQALALAVGRRFVYAALRRKKAV